MKQWPLYHYLARRDRDELMMSTGYAYSEEEKKDIEDMYATEAPDLTIQFYKAEETSE